MDNFFKENINYNIDTAISIFYTFIIIVIYSITKI